MTTDSTRRAGRRAGRLVAAAIGCAALVGGGAAFPIAAGHRPLTPKHALAAPQKELYVKHVHFPAGADSATKVDMASRLVPSPKQLQWQKLGMTAFLHFGMNTFTDREWGDGSEDPSLFNPTDLSADQWVKTLRDAGFGMVILTAKHHDGFCLWPTATTAHSVKASPWQGGAGDVMAQLRQACDKYGMKLGVYLSPWDRNAPVYGDSEAYNDMFVNQLTELLSNYGTIDEVWFDGACGEGPNGKKQEYDWARFRSVMERLQPGAVLAIMGDDVRWVGNEKGLGRETEWSATALTPGILPGADEANRALGLASKSPDLGGRDIVARASDLYWWPSEVDVSVRPGWFYHDSEQPKTVAQLADIYLQSVGRNSVLLLNVPPDRRGRIAAADSAALAGLGRWIRENFNFDKELTGEPSRTIHPAWVTLPARGEAADTLAALPWISLVRATTHAPSAPVINCVGLAEDIAKGQHIEEFAIDVLTDVGAAERMALAMGEAAPLVDTPHSDSMKLMAKEAAALATEAAVGDQGLWREVARGTTVGYRRLLTFPDTEARAVRLRVLKSRGVPDLEAFNIFRLEMPDTAQAEQTLTLLDTDGWTPLRPGKSRTADNLPSLGYDMGAPTAFAGFVYTPQVADGSALPGTIFKYRFLISDDGQEWKEVPTTGEFSNIVNNPIQQIVEFAAPVEARYVKLVSLAEAQGRDTAPTGTLRLIELK